ncbi:hypothetical protein DER45DRAFT_645599 [Fusarium avenaceum]|nr:hypothetical protein DER45DRAFT_645599 [Fusarium avenaceum]
MECCLYSILGRYVKCSWYSNRDMSSAASCLLFLLLLLDPAMPLVPSTSSLPSSMTTFAYLREQKILNIVYVGLLVVEVLMVLGVITTALIKRVKGHYQRKSIPSPLPSPTYAPYHFAHADSEKTML